MGFYTETAHMVLYRNCTYGFTKQKEGKIKLNKKKKTLIPPLDVRFAWW
jgi:hypothetical protein